MTFANILGAPWLGHGRMLEATLALICAAYGLVLLLHPDALYDSQATRDMAWQTSGQYVWLPFALKAFLTGLGLIGNINGWPFSRFLRFCGAWVGSFLWASIISKFVIMGVPFTFGSVCAAAFLVSSIRIIGMSLADLPKPGAPGAGNI